jgi:hypothetical protein
MFSRLHSFNNLKSFPLFFAVLLVSAIYPQSVQSQTTYSSLTDIPAPPTVAVGSPTGSYALSQVESINLYSGRLTAFVPLWFVGGRGEVNIPIGVTPGVQWSAKLPSSPSAGPIIPETNMTIESFLPGTLTYKENQQTTTCSSGSPVVNSTLSRFEYRAFDGTSHELRDTQTNGAIAHTGAICG